VMGDSEINHVVDLKACPIATEGDDVVAGTRWDCRRIQFSWIPAGEFMMGRPDCESGYDDEVPAHKVRFKRGFWMGKHAGVRRQLLCPVGDN